MYRTKTYIAGDWDGDQDLICKLYEWNDSDYWRLSFTDAHEFTQARDTSLACSIKKSLADRLNISKTFVLIVGQKTDSLTKGGCQLCSSYNSYSKYCVRGNQIDYRSFVEYECEKAYRDKLKIVVIYNYATIHKEKCPEVLRNTGNHIVGYFEGQDGKYYWNKAKIADAIMN